MKFIFGGGGWGIHFWEVYEGRSKSFEPDYLPLDFWAKKCYWPYQRSLISIL